MPVRAPLHAALHPALVAAAALTAASAVLLPAPAGAQAPDAAPTAASLAEATATPEEAAALFLRSIRAIRFDAAARVVHPRTLERVHVVVRLIADADSTGQVRRYLTDTDSAGFAALSPAQVFDRALGATIDDMPGLMHAVFDRDDAVIGHVAEGADSAHVVYRTEARISGAVPEVKVMQLAATPDGWRVLWSDELEVLEAALRGVARPVRPPPGGPTPGGPPSGSLPPGGPTPASPPSPYE